MSLKQQTEWFVLYTAPRAEKKVKERIEMGGGECFLPLHRTPRVWSDRVKIVDIPLYNSYLFVRTTDTELRTYLKIPGVVRIVFYCDKPAILRQKEIDTIQAFLEQAAEQPLCSGDEVEILAGVMKHVSGKIRKIRKDYLLLYIEQLGATVCVKTGSVARIDRLLKR